MFVVKLLEKTNRLHVEPQERSRLLGSLAVSSLDLVGINKRQRLTWVKLDERKVLRRALY